jgi:hypothetical protein
VFVAVALSVQTGCHTLVHNTLSAGRVPLPVVGIWREKGASMSQLSTRTETWIVSRELTAYPGIHQQDRSLVGGELLTEGVASFTLPGGEQDS